jgi:hypothetical protein
MSTKASATSATFPLTPSELVGTSVTLSRGRVEGPMIGATSLPPIRVATLRERDKLKTRWLQRSREFDWPIAGRASDRAGQRNTKKPRVRGMIRGGSDDPR